MKKLFVFLISLAFYFFAQANEKFTSFINLSGSDNSELGIEMELPDIDFYGDTDQCPPEPGYPGAGNYFDPFGGSVHRKIHDLEVWGGVGEEQLIWIRYGHSGSGDYVRNYGNAHNWNSSYQYDMVDVGSGIRIHYPQGGQDIFVKVDQIRWSAGPGKNKWLFQYGNNFFLQKSDGFRYRFEKLGSGANTYYQLQDFLDKYKNLYILTYDNTTRKLTRITEPAGRYLEISYSLVNNVRVIAQVETRDLRKVTYNYTVMNGFVCLTGATYGDGTSAIYSYIQSPPGSQPMLAHAIDPRYRGSATNMKYTYLPFSNGFIKEERNGVTNEVMATLDASTANKTVIYPNGLKQVFSSPVNDFSKTNSYTDGFGSRSQVDFADGGKGFRQSETDALGRTTTYENRTSVKLILN